MYLSASLMRFSTLGFLSTSNSFLDLLEGLKGDLDIVYKFVCIYNKYIRLFFLNNCTLLSEWQIWDKAQNDSSVSDCPAFLMLTCFFSHYKVSLYSLNKIDILYLACKGYLKELLIDI